MADIQETLRQRARELLESGEVKTFIGWEAGRFDNQTTPCIITDPSKTDRLVWNRYCTNLLGKYPMDAVDRGKVGVVVRGCDSRAIVRLIVEQVINREDVYLIGVGCPGMLNRETDELLKKCAECRHHNPVIFDEMIGEESDATSELDRFYEIEETAAMPRGEREVYFDHIFAKCIRCYACRDVCPCCTCRQCFVDQSREGWIGKQNNIAENRFYGLTRVMHIADRCIECGECERVCPMNLPLMQLNRKVIHDIDELFNAEEAGLSLDEPFAALNTYSLDDVEEFM